MNNNPYLRGKLHCEYGFKANNPYPEFSEKWALYNEGYNSAMKHKSSPSGAYWPREYVQSAETE